MFCIAKTFAPIHVKKVPYINHMNATFIPNYLGSKVLQENISTSAPTKCMYIIDMFVMWPPKSKPSQPTTSKVISEEAYLY